MYELRILSGLHRGAALPLDDHPHLIGASDDADVVLVDEGVSPRHATLSRTETGWLLAASDGEVFSAETNLHQALLDLAPGDFARVGDVWLTVVLQDAPWESPPPVPVDEAFDPVAAEDDGAAAMETAASTAAADVPEQAEAATAAVHAARPPFQWSRPRLLAGSMAATVLLSAAAYAITSKPEPAAKVGAMQESRGPVTNHHNGSASRNATDAESRPLSQDELRKAFRKRLNDAELLDRFEMTLDNHAWTMQADLNDEEKLRFQRILKAFLQEHRITFPVDAKMVSAEAMLPFRIRQVITGTNASVVTQDGQRLFIGEEYRGVRVVAIQGNRLVFAGKRKIEMNW